MYRLPRAITLRQQNLIRPRISRIGQQRRFESRFLKSNGEPVRYQSVRFKRAPFTWRKAARYGLYGGAFYAYWTYFSKFIHVEVEMLEDMEDEEEGEGDGEDEEDDGYADEDSTFIPFTWAKKMPRTFYKGSDPEWQEFVKIAKDKQRHTKIQNELVQVVHTGASQHPGIQRQLGKDTKIGKYWLDISFPDGPPQEYERSGIEIADTYIAWSHQKISPEAQWRLTRALWPKAAFDSVWATSKMLLGINWRRFKQSVGLEGKDPFSPEERYKHAVEMMEKQRAEKQGKQVSKAQLEPNANPSAVGDSAASSGARSSAVGNPSKLPFNIEVPMPSSGDSMDVPIAMHVFQSTLSKQWNPKKMEPPRGTFVVQGLVEVRGSRGRMLFDVQSCYDPKAAKFTTVNASVRNFKRWNQAPRGGP